jgi:hypothetical protein
MQGELVPCLSMGVVDPTSTIRRSTSGWTGRVPAERPGTTPVRSAAEWPHRATAGTAAAARLHRSCRLRRGGYFAVTEKAFVTKSLPPDDDVIS